MTFRAPPCSLRDENFVICNSSKGQTVMSNIVGNINGGRIASIQNCKLSNFTVKCIQTLLSVGSSTYLCLSAINEPCVLNITNWPASMSWFNNWSHHNFSSEGRECNGICIGDKCIRNDTHHLAVSPKHCGQHSRNLDSTSELGYLIR